MTTIILVSIGILLAAVAALMVIFYGGDAFGSGSVSAQASTLINAGQNVLSAADLRRAETGSIGASIPDLISTRHLDVRPSMTGANGQDVWRLAATGSGGDATLYVADGLSRELCLKLLQRLHEGPTPQPYVTGRMGCYSPEGGEYAFYTVLDQVTGTTEGKLAGSFDWNGLTQTTPYLYTPSGVPGMTFTGGAGLTLPNSPWLFPAAPDGGNLVFMQDAGTVSMDVAGLTPGAEYEVRFYIAARPKVTVDEIQGGGDELHVDYAGQRIGTFNPASTSFAQVVTSRFRAVSGKDSIVFSADPSGRDQTTGFDGVKVVRIS